MLDPAHDGKMAKWKAAHGGARPGAGRPAGTVKPEAERKVSVSVRLDPALKARALEIGDGSLSCGIATALAAYSSRQQEAT